MVAAGREPLRGRRSKLQAHIHCGARGVNGPVEVFLYGPAAPQGRVQGVLAEGTFDPSAHECDGVPLLQAMRAGNTYVNVHTTVNPGGEIRGQIAAGAPRQ